MRMGNYIDWKAIPPSTDFGRLHDPHVYTCNGEGYVKESI
jgi:hypothetical protein